MRRGADSFSPGGFTWWRTDRTAAGVFEEFVGIELAATNGDEQNPHAFGCSPTKRIVISPQEEHASRMYRVGLIGGGSFRALTTLVPSNRYATKWPYQQ